MIFPSKVLETAISQFGKKYVYASSPSPTIKNPPSFDCSGYVHWVCGRNGITIPQGSWNQALWCRDNGMLMSVQDAINTPGALLFAGDNNGYSGYGPSGHVGFSLGNGKTAEARGSAYGVGSWSAYNRPWTNAGMIPGVTYNVPPVNANSIFMTDLINKVKVGPILNLGSRGFDVKVWQCALNAGIGSNLIGDGSFGPQTVSATKDFQRFWKLSADGVVGPKSRALMAYTLSLKI